MGRRPPRLMELIEDERFFAQLESLGDIKAIDDALAGIYWAISRDPKAYEIVPGFKDIRLAKASPGGAIRLVRVWYRLENENQIKLLSIEAITE